MRYLAAAALVAVAAIATAQDIKPLDLVDLIKADLKYREQVNSKESKKDGNVFSAKQALDDHRAYIKEVRGKAVEGVVEVEKVDFKSVRKQGPIRKGEAMYSRVVVVALSLDGTPTGFEAHAKFNADPVLPTLKKGDKIRVKGFMADTKLGSALIEHTIKFAEFEKVK